MGLAVPVIVTGVPPPAGAAVTVYKVTELPPSVAGGLKLTVTCPLPGVAVTFCGAEGGTGVAGGTVTVPG